MKNPHHNNEIEEFRLKMMILMKFDEKYAQCNGCSKTRIFSFSISAAINDYMTISGIKL